MRTPSVLLLAAFTGAACAGGVHPDQDQGDGFAVAAGKEDNFYSLTAREFLVRGDSTVTIEESLAAADDDAKLARVKELVSMKHVAFAWFLSEYLVKKESDDANSDWGGMGGLNKAGSYEDLDIEAVDARTYRFTFQHIVVGPDDLMQKLPLVTDGAHRRFDLVIGKPSNAEMARLETNAEWYRSAPWSDFNPATVREDQKETLSLTIEPERESTDAFFDYNALLADDVLDIDVHFGWDYHSEYHVKHARSLFFWLGRRGYEAPVVNFDELTRTSGAFTRTLRAHGRDVEVRVRIFYGKTGSDTDPDTDAGGRVLEEDMRASLATKDVIVYSGHSGPFYGFALGNWKRTSEGDLDDSEMSTVLMPENRYQVILAEGCDTYQIGQAFQNNPAKPGGAFVDVITTTQSSDATSPEAVQDLISRLTETDSSGEHRPRTMKSLIKDLDSISYWFKTWYGIHGIDDSPKLHPYADLEALCTTCRDSDDCGGTGNACITIGENDGSKRCAAVCTDDSGCPTGYRCAEVASRATSRIYTSACVPTSLSCQ